MKNKSIFNLFLWLSVIIFGSYFYYDIQKQGKNKFIAIKQSEIFLVEKTKAIAEPVIDEFYTTLKEIGFNPKLSFIYDTVKSGLNRADSVYLTGELRWSELQNPLSSDFNQHSLSKYNEYINYQSENNLINTLHQLSLYRLNRQSHLNNLQHSVSCSFVIFDGLYLDYDTYSSKIFLHYRRQKKRHHSQIYHKGKLISSLSFDNQKDTTLLFDIKTDYVSSGIKDETKSYQLRIRAGQTDNFQIEELK